MGQFTNQRRRFIKRNKTLWQRVVIVSLLAIFIQTNISTEQAVPIVYKDRPPLMSVNAKEVARELLNKEQFLCLTKLVGKESGWKASAQNPNSSASGLGQLLDSTYSRLGMKQSDSGVAQLVATLSYIHRRWVTPCNAWQNWQKHKSY